MNWGRPVERHAAGRGNGRRRCARPRVRAAAALAATAGALLAATAGYPVPAQADSIPEPSATPTPTAAPSEWAQPGAGSLSGTAPTSTPAAPSQPAGPSASPTPAATKPAPKLLALTPGSHEFTVESPAMDVTNLAFTGTQTVTSGTATLIVLAFTAGSATLHGMTLTDPCVSTPAVPQSWKAVHSVPDTSTAALAGPVALLATSLSYTPAGGTTVTFDATTLPPAGVLVPTGTLPVVQITATSLTAATATVQNLTTETTTC